MKNVFRNKKLINAIYLIIALIAFSLSIFKTDNPIWIAAWIAPIFLIRFMRNTKWPFAILFSFLTLQIASFIGSIPQLNMMSTVSIKMDFLFIILWQLRSGALFYVPALLIPSGYYAVG